MTPFQVGQAFEAIARKSELTVAEVLNCHMVCMIGLLESATQGDRAEMAIELSRLAQVGVTSILRPVPAEEEKH